MFKHDAAAAAAAADAAAAEETSSKTISPAMLRRWRGIISQTYIIFILHS